MLTKSLSCNVAVLTRIPYYFSKYSEIISLIWKGPYYDKFQFHKLHEGIFKVLGRFCEVSNSAKVRSLVLVWTVQWSVRIPSCVEKILIAQVCIHPDVRATPSSRFSVQEESKFPLQTHIGKDSLQPSGRGLNKETREARYGKAVAQFTVQMPSAYVRTPPKEIQISVDLGILKPVNRGFYTYIIHRIRYWIL
jgi:hypothetical protein